MLRKLDDLSKRVETLEAENRHLKERLNNNSSNSSLPPSKSQKKRKSNRQSSGKKAGGQPGHKGHHRKLLPIEQVDFIQNCLLPTNCKCGEKINLSGEHIRHQVYELLVLKLNITEYQLEQGGCHNCRCKHVAPLPEGINGPQANGVYE
ncbi:hypothetical protein BH10PSE19_BH10PSE19_10940 [soil metagenome]